MPIDQNNRHYMDEAEFPVSRYRVGRAPTPIKNERYFTYEAWDHMFVEYFVLDKDTRAFSPSASIRMFIF